MLFSKKTKEVESPQIEEVIEERQTIKAPEKDSWISKYWKHQTDEEKQEIYQIKKQIENERIEMRKEEKEKLYRDFDVDALFVDPVEPSILEKYLPMVSIVLMIITILIVAIKK